LTGSAEPGALHAEYQSDADLASLSAFFSPVHKTGEGITVYIQACEESAERPE